ncbi:unnamed protein product [Cuscuta epithymum]|uniref:Uncharacterized protein n=1 Tax=Cuscuta epithymum TaxID=186058 RepID=A0AAV0D332_9ASTE|nr:unnamed protein product [Cuscuta epithymum]
MNWFSRTMMMRKMNLKNDNKDEKVRDKGFKAKVMDEIQALREHVAALESRLKLMEERFSAQGGVPEKATEIGSKNKVMEMEVDDDEVEDKDQVEQDVENEPTHVEEVAAAVGEPTMTDVTTTSNHIISPILIEVADVVSEPSGEMADANHATDCDVATPSKQIISPDVLKVTDVLTEPSGPMDDSNTVREFDVGG